MEEKKLTDEEIVKALECCVKGETCTTCPYFIKRIDCVYHRRAEDNALDFIRRLQYRCSSAIKASDEWKEKYEKERKENAEQKAEIERLKATGLLKENEQLKKDLQRKELLRQKAVLYAEEKQAKNAELQKQVDELKELNAKYLDSIESVQAGRCRFRCELTQQAVKDTAKEIYGEINVSDILVVETQEYGEIEVVPIERLKEIIKRKGVEVE